MALTAQLSTKTTECSVMKEERDGALLKSQVSEDKMLVHQLSKATDIKLHICRDSTVFLFNASIVSTITTKHSSMKEIVVKLILGHLSDTDICPTTEISFSDKRPKVGHNYIQNYARNNGI